MGYSAYLTMTKQVVIPTKVNPEFRKQWYEWCRSRNLIPHRVQVILLQALMEGSIDFEQFKFRYDNYYVVLKNKRKSDLAKGREKRWTERGLDKSNTL